MFCDMKDSDEQITFNLPQHNNALNFQEMAKESFHMGWQGYRKKTSEFKSQNVMNSAGHQYSLNVLEKFISKKNQVNLEQVILPTGK